MCCRIVHVVLGSKKTERGLTSDVGLLGRGGEGVKYKDCLKVGTKRKEYAVDIEL